MPKAKPKAAATPLAVERVPMISVHLDPANARSHPTRNIEAIKASLVRFGQQTPIVLDAKGICRKGNGTVLAARELGWESILAVRTKLEATEAAAYAIADNRTAELAAWDDKALAEQLRAFQGVEDFDLSSVGFTEAEIDGLLERMGTAIIAGAGSQDGLGNDRPPSDDSGDESPLHSFRTVIFTEEQWPVITRAVEMLRESECDPAIKEGRCLELIAADYMAGA